VTPFEHPARGRHLLPRQYTGISLIHSSTCRGFAGCCGRVPVPRPCTAHNAAGRSSTLHFAAQLQPATGSCGSILEYRVPLVTCHTPPLRSGIIFYHFDFIACPHSRTSRADTLYFLLLRTFHACTAPNAFSACQPDDKHADHPALNRLEMLLAAC